MPARKPPRVSVVIPAYNAMAYLPEAIESVLAQTFADYDVVIVDDGSNDNIQTWVTTIKDPRVRLVSQANRGLAGARNTGIRESDGDYIAFLDADDRWHPTKLEKQVTLMEASTNIGVVYTWMTLVNQTGEPTGRFVNNCVEGNVWESLILSNCVGSGSNPMVRRTCFEQVGDFDENLGSYMEDRDMWLRIAPYYEFAVVKESLVDYRQHPSSASKNWVAMARSARIILDKAVDMAPSYISDEVKCDLIKRSWARINLSLAWKPLQSLEKDYQTSQRFMGEAIANDPTLRFSREFLRLNLTLLTMRCLGTNTYTRLLSRLHTLRGQILSL
ncbi:glycosyltransferase family 2 protein [Leptothoe spongobia]|uniref:Glycosyltransferase family 2 protein n=1 Tax=Leptothoe spongobia TAU-MAC 1115 TaxID=1967444 RepID=A0A947DHU0_9CYAN|nr:glycosyltransferase family A protein [Leptothoe spongobia]MBT9317206.1 glycosyltransferase family 2 protein [Leptothoe spongobia TAU-MAC 1115]